MLVIINILSCDSEIIISSGNNPDSLVCTLLTSNSIPIPKLSAISETAHDNPPPPKSFIALMQFSFLASRIVSMINFSMKGSGICIADLSSPSKESDANCDPPIPSRPVEPPIRTTKSPLLA